MKTINNKLVIAIALLVFIIFLVMQFPARHAYALLVDPGSGIQLYEPEGTLWHGQAKALDVNNQRFQNFEWQLNLWSVVLARLNINWSFDNGEAYGSGTVGLGLGRSIKLSSVKANLPGAMVQPYLSQVPAKLGGVFSVDIDELYYDAATAETTATLRSVEGQLIWHNAAITVLNELALGEFQLNMTTDESGIVGLLKEAENSDLLAEGRLSLASDNNYKVDVTLAVRHPNQRRDLSQGLSFLGRPDEEGQYKVSYSGQL